MEEISVLLFKEIVLMQVMKILHFAVRLIFSFVRMYVSYFSFHNLDNSCNSTEIQCVNPGSGPLCVPTSSLCNGIR